MELGKEEAEEGASLEKELEEERTKSEDLLTRLKYAQADLENYRKRAEKDMAEARDASLRGLVIRLLVVLDEMALAVKHAASGGKAGDLSEGFSMVQKKFEAALESVGVQRIESVGKRFDPALHEAAEKVKGSPGGDEIVVEELRPGYVLRGQVLRPSLVKVGPGEEEE